MCDYDEEPYISTPKAYLRGLLCKYGRGVKSMKPMDEFSSEFVIKCQEDFGQEVENINIIASTLCFERPPWRLLYLTLWLDEILGACWANIERANNSN